MEQIPLDLVVQILLKLLAKSIARFRCVWKRWDSTFRSPYFTESFFTISSSPSSQPMLLFAFRSRLDGNMYLFSSASPQPQSWCPSNSITVNFHMSFPINCRSAIGRPVGGLVCGNSKSDIFATEYPELLICNPSTGLMLNLTKSGETRLVCSEKLFRI